MTRVLLIGGTGLIGPWVLASLHELEPGAEIWVMNRRGLAPEGVTTVRGDRHDPAALDAAQLEVVIDGSPSLPPRRRRLRTRCASTGQRTGLSLSPRRMSTTPSRD